MMMDVAIESPRIISVQHKQLINGRFDANRFTWKFRNDNIDILAG